MFFVCLVTLLYIFPVKEEKGFKFKILKKCVFSIKKLKTGNNAKLRRVSQIQVSRPKIMGKHSNDI